MKWGTQTVFVGFVAILLLAAPGASARGNSVDWGVVGGIAIFFAFFGVAGLCVFCVLRGGNGTAAAVDRELEDKANKAHGKSSGVQKAGGKTDESHEAANVVLRCNAQHGVFCLTNDPEPAVGDEMNANNVKNSLLSSNTLYSHEEGVEDEKRNAQHGVFCLTDDPELAVADDMNDSNNLKTSLLSSNTLYSHEEGVEDEKRKGNKPEDDFYP